MLQAIIMGLVQGLTEFLPVSSSGHLVVVPYLFQEQLSRPPLAFDVALHFGTLLAVVAYFAGDLVFLATRTFGIGASSPDEVRRARTTVALLAVASVPAALAGFLLEQQFAQTFEDPRFAASFLLVTAAILWGAERLRRSRVAAAAGVAVGELSHAQRLEDPGRDEGTTTFADAITIGLAQALAILPGISRSGATIAAGMARGLSREGAARFSFLMAVPVILGASVFTFGDMTNGTLDGTPYGGAGLYAGVAAAAVSGFWAIRYLLRLVVNEDLIGFARYVAFLGALTWLGYLWIGPASQI